MELLSREPRQDINKIFMRAHEIKDARNDYTADLRRISMLPSQEMYFADGVGRINKMPVSDWALSQVCSKLGIPGAYIAKCYDDVAAGELAAENINYWMMRTASDASRTPRAMIRTYQGMVDGFLSTRYTPFDSDQILDVMGCEMGSALTDDYCLKGSYISDERLHLRLVESNAIVPDDDLFGAIFIDSSDVGRRMLTITYGIWKQVCTNGLIVCKAGGALFVQRHINITAEEFAVGLQQALSCIPSIRQKAIEMIAAAKGKQVDFSDVNALAETIRHQIVIDRKTAENVINLALTRYGTSQWGLINAITEQAQEYSLDERIRLEQAAGALLSA